MTGAATLEGPREGASYKASRDEDRLNRQALVVFRVMKDGQWRSLKILASLLEEPEASISARLRDFRKEEFGGHTVEKRNRGGGLWEYRLIVRRPEQLGFDLGDTHQEGSSPKRAALREIQSMKTGFE